MGLNFRVVVAILVLCSSAFAVGATEKGGQLGVRTNDGRKQFTLNADRVWQLNSPRKARFDASALAFWKGKLLTVNDRDGQIYEIIPGTNDTSELKPIALFDRAAVVKAGLKLAPRYDVEGMAVDSSGTVYISEESKRSIFKTTHVGAPVERLTIEWSPVTKFFGKDSNASFEGIAISNSKLYVANERDAARIIVVDRASLRVLDSFTVDSTSFAFGGPHYSDLCYFGEHLFVLDRNHRAILEVEPETRRVVAEYSFGAMEVSPDTAYRTVYPTGTMEGLAIDADYFWLVTDNNGLNRIKDFKDNRPTLFRCKRPK